MKTVTTNPLWIPCTILRTFVTCVCVCVCVSVPVHWSTPSGTNDYKSRDNKWKVSLNVSARDHVVVLFSWNGTHTNLNEACHGWNKATHKGPVTRKMFPFDDVIIWLTMMCHSPYLLLQPILFMFARLCIWCSPWYSINYLYVII